METNNNHILHQSTFISIFLYEIKLASDLDNNKLHLAVLTRDCIGYDSMIIIVSYIVDYWIP